MSNSEANPSSVVCPRSAAPSEPAADLLLPRAVQLGTRGLAVRRTLPHRDRYTVGAWCFVDHYGPEPVRPGRGMRLPPHPHFGLQTVSWLLEGQVLHRDSLGSIATVAPGELNLMTSGRAIAHSEQSPDGHYADLHGVQLWIALPDDSRWQDPSFEHHEHLPVLTATGAQVTVILGEIAGSASPASVFSPLVGAEVRLDAAAELDLPLEPDFEHAVLAVSGDAVVAGHDVPRGALLYLGRGRETLRMVSAGSAVLLLLGGTPLAEDLLMWWNFVGRTQAEIEQAREDWEAGRRFGTVAGFGDERLPAPVLPTTPLRPRRSAQARVRNRGDYSST